MGHRLKSVMNWMALPIQKFPAMADWGWMLQEIEIELAYHTTYPEPPSKSVLHDVMLKLVEGMCSKNIPFSFFVGDMLTYKTILQLKAEIPDCFKDIIPFLNYGIPLAGVIHLSNLQMIPELWHGKHTVWYS